MKDVKLANAIKLRQAEMCLEVFASRLMKVSKWIFKMIVNFVRTREEKEK